MQQGHAGGSLVFWFDHYWWLVWMVLFGALLASAYTHRKDPYCKGGDVLRHDMAARISHWFNAAGILVLIYSGFMLGFLWFPRQVAFTEGAQAMFNLHFVGAILFLFGAIYWVGNTFLAPKRLEEHAPYRGSLKDAIIHYAHLTGLTKKKGAPTGKYEASERLAFVPLTLLALFMGVTGLIKMMAHVWHLPTGLMTFATATHDWSTIVLVVLLLFHVVLAAVVPWAWPLLKSMITGWVPVAFVKAHHPGWYEELLKEGVCQLPEPKARPTQESEGTRNA
ncbi:cytochrome b/b6 domain-containing protein [Hydrogenimonas sp.]